MANGGGDVSKKSRALALPDQDTVFAEYQETGSSPALLELVHAADRGDADALARLKALYARFPVLAATVSSWQYAAEREILGTAQPGIAETFAEQANRWRKKLAGDDPSPLESLLVNRIILDHLHALKSEHTLQQKIAGTLSFEQAEYYQKQAERAQRRLLRSVKALADVRRLMRPALQVNIADQQVNVAGDVQAGPRRTG
jgi:hypothetical protein